MLPLLMTVNNPLHSRYHIVAIILHYGQHPVVPTVRVNGDGAGATASVTLSTAGEVTGVTIGAGGTGYTYCSNVTFTGGGGGFGAAAYATIATGAVTGIVIDRFRTGLYF